jgi:two-component system cell cycle response regulator DivK
MQGRATMAPPDTLPAQSELRGKVLYVEDDPINMVLVESTLQAFPGITMIKAATGAEGIRLARTEWPDLVILDMHLPDMGGLEVVRTLNEEIASGRLRVVLLTADYLSMDIVKAMSLGAYEYWLKPIDVVKLEKSLHRALAADKPERAR